MRTSAAVSHPITQEAATGGRRFYKRLGLLYALNLADWLCTEALLRSGRFVEANPIMRPVMGQLPMALLIKVALPLFLVLLCAVIYRLAGEIESKFANALLLIGLAAYSLVNLWHIFNFVLLFSSF